MNGGGGVRATWRGLLVLLGFAGLVPKRLTAGRTPTKKPQLIVATRDANVESAAEKMLRRRGAAWRGWGHSMPTTGAMGRPFSERVRLANPHGGAFQLSLSASSGPSRRCGGHSKPIRKLLTPIRGQAPESAATH
jgi:hypothetical protein